MSPPSTFARWPAAFFAFAAAIAGTWTMRFVFSPDPSAERRPSIPVVRGTPQSDGASKAGEGATLLSVKWEIVQWPPTGDASDVAQAFAAAWRELEPHANASFFGEDVSDTQNKARQLFADWWKLDPDAALRFVSEPPGVFIERGGMFLLPLIARRDPRLAWKLSDLAMERDERKAARYEVMRVWANRAPEEAMTFAASLPASQRSDAERAAVRGWASHHAADAISWAAALPESWRKNELTKEIVRGASASDPAALAAALRSGKISAKDVGLTFFESDDNGREPATRLARAAIASDPDPLGFCVWASGPRMSHLASAAWAALLEREGVNSVDGIVRFAASVPESGRVAISAALGTVSPEAGLKWALASGTPLGPLAASWAKSNPEAALAALRAVPQSAEVIAALRAAAMEARETAPVAVLQTLASLPPEESGKGAQRAMHSAIKKAAFTDPVRTLEVLGTLPDVTPQDISMVLAAGAHRDPHGTAAALARIELPVTELVAAESFARGWAAADPAAASVWVRKLPPGEMRDGGAAGLANSVARADPPGAFAWAVEITEPEMRQGVLRTVIEFAVKAGTPLDSLLNESRLSPEEHAMLRAHAATVSKP